MSSITTSYSGRMWIDDKGLHFEPWEDIGQDPTPPTTQGDTQKGGEE